MDSQHLEGPSLVMNWVVAVAVALEVVVVVLEVAAVVLEVTMVVEEWVEVDLEEEAMMAVVGEWVDFEMLT